MATSKRRVGNKVRVVTLEDGRVFPLALPEVIGEGKCPDEAHKSAFVDHCMTCLSHRWGAVELYAPIDVRRACADGKVVAVIDLPDDVNPYDLTTRDSDLCLVQANETGKYASNYYVIAPKETK